MPDEKDEKLEFLKRVEVRTMQKDLSRLRENEAQVAQDKLTKLKPHEKTVKPIKEAEEIPFRKEIPVNLIPKELPKKLSSSQKIIVRTGLVLILILTAGFFYWSLVKEESTTDKVADQPAEQPVEEPIEQPVEEPVKMPEIVIPSSLIPVETVKNLEIENLNEAIPALSNLLKDEIEPRGFTRILIENKTENKILGLKDFFEAFEISSPEGLLGKLNNDFTLFVYSTQDANRLGFVTKVEETEGLLNLLKAWENSMEKDTETLFVSLNKKEPALVSYFRNGSWNNINYRYLTISKDDFGICYSMLDNYFIFTTSWKSLAETIDSLLKLKQETAPKEETIEKEVLIPSIVERILNWGYHVPETPRIIDTIIIHSAYNAIGGDVHDIEKVIEEFRTYGVTPHYLITRDGIIYQLAPDEAIAYHAGYGKMPDGSRKNIINFFSIGIELIHTKTESPNETQYQSLTQLTKQLREQYNIIFENILGHNQITPERKDDPWNFDWEYFKSLLET